MTKHLLYCLLLAAAVLDCAPKKAGPVRIVASTTLIGTIVQSIGGNRLDRKSVV